MCPYRLQARCSGPKTKEFAALLSLVISVRHTIINSSQFLGRLCECAHRSELQPPAPSGKRQVPTLRLSILDSGEHNEFVLQDLDVYSLERLPIIQLFGVCAHCCVTVTEAVSHTHSAVGEPAVPELTAGESGLYHLIDSCSPRFTQIETEDSQTGTGIGPEGSINIRARCDEEVYPR